MAHKDEEQRPSAPTKIGNVITGTETGFLVP